MKFQTNEQNSDLTIKYIGEMDKNIREGFGLQIWNDGAAYIGYWKDHKAHGLGKFKHSDGDIYQGFNTIIHRRILR